MSEWREAAANTGETWDGQGIIEGQYISKKTEVGKNRSNLYALKTDKETKGVWGSTVLDTKFDEIPIGSLVKIEFLGMAESKNGNEYKDYKVLYKPAPFVEAGASQVSAQDAAKVLGGTVEDDEVPVSAREPQGEESPF